jgi:DNA polymerase-4
VVSGRPDIHSVVAAASKEAKRYGIKAGMSTWEAKKLCPEVIFVPGDPDKYESVTRRFLGILISYTPMVEVYSIDEVFLDATEILPRYPDPIALALEIKRKFREELGEWITCTIGIAPNKLLAKLATEEAKPNGIKWIRPEDVPEVFAEYPGGGGVRDRPEDRQTPLLHGCLDPGRFRKNPRGVPEKGFRGSMGLFFTSGGMGVDPTPLKPYWQEEEEKSIGHSHALPKSLRHPEGARRVLYYLSVKTARRLRKKGFVGRVIFAIYRDEEMKYFGRPKKPSPPLPAMSAVSSMRQWKSWRGSAGSPTA